jgi:hypothetical protein
LGARVQMLQNTVIPERPMYYPEFPPQGTAARHILCVAPLNSSMEYPFSLFACVKFNDGKLVSWHRNCWVQNALQC